ncbi:hypothetical protein J4E85_008558 [Alternaria conjuncta]|uniref:uncharacterized protein n=1 Tax=Alternaria conjuncta TaxID=181017 RepID=UPI0022206A51|nr:uncharacterized protein J4E85_008558 [Alternaria conjuncta]KAI4923519.1 hypothetical protein J4E85_008558 [Alternaria conjuncta]
MAATTRINPLRSYIGKGAKANVQIKAHPKSTLVAGAATTQAEEGDEYAYTSADDLSDNPYLLDFLIDRK